MIDPPFFLIGAERSGSTLLRLMLDHHPDIACNLESDFIVSEMPEGAGWPAMAQYRDWLAHDRVFQHSKFRIDSKLDYPALVGDFLRQKKQRDGKRLVGATVHHHFARLLRIWPDAKYLYLLRDGRDVSRSVMQMGWANNLWTAADVWLEAEATWDAMQPMLKQGQWIEVRYEDLIADSVKVLTKICAFLEVPFSDQMFDYAATSTYDRPDPKLIYQWKRSFSQRDLQLVEARLADRLQKRGYELSGLPILPVSPAMDRRLRRQSRIGTYKRRIGKLGLSLVLQETVARRIGMSAWQRRCQEMIDRIVDTNLK